MNKQPIHPTTAKSWNVQPVELSEFDLREAVEEVICSGLRDHDSVLHVNRKPCEFATLFPLDVLEVVLASGRSLRLLLKHFGEEDSSHPDKQQYPLREISVYRELLRSPHLPVAEYYGDRFNERTQHHELYLEYIDDWNLKYHELKHWRTAARRLAHFHSFFSLQAERLEHFDFLLRFNDQYLYEWAERAVSAVCSVSQPHAIRLQRLVDKYSEAVRLICTQPKTLVHNDLSPKNVIAQSSQDPARICFVDWEMAGVGCGVLDLVHLNHGLEKQEGRAMVEAYRRELKEDNSLSKSSREFERLLAACELHKALYRLAHCVTWQLTQETVIEWVGNCEQWHSRI